VFKYEGALSPDQHSTIYVVRDEDRMVRKRLAYVGNECILVSLIGARQTGKTSLLNFLHSEYSCEPEWIGLRIDMSVLSEFDGEEWYGQLIALCIEKLQLAGLNITETDLVSNSRQMNIASPYSAYGWTRFIYLACNTLSSNQKLLISLDEINSTPKAQWEPFFSSIRAIHQSASLLEDKPEYRRLGMILAGAFVPKQLISIVEKSPFNVSTKIYMSLCQQQELDPLIRMLEERGTILESHCVEAIHYWTSGLLVHVQRLCEKILQCDNRPITKPMIDKLVEQIEFDDSYLSHIINCLEKDLKHVKPLKRILNSPYKSNRNSMIIATLEIVGAIKICADTNEWNVTNRICKRAIQSHIDTVTNLSWDGEPKSQSLQLSSAPIVAQTLEESSANSVQIFNFVSWPFLSVLCGAGAVMFALLIWWIPSIEWKAVIAGLVFLGAIITLFILWLNPVNFYRRWLSYVIPGGMLINAVGFTFDAVLVTDVSSGSFKWDGTASGLFFIAWAIVTIGLVWGDLQQKR